MPCRIQKDNYSLSLPACRFYVSMHRLKVMGYLKKGASSAKQPNAALLRRHFYVLTLRRPFFEHDAIWC